AGIEVVDDEDEDDDEPRRQFRAKRKKRSNKGLLIALALIGTVVFFGGAGIAVYYLLSGGGGEEPLAYLPADTQIVAGFNLGALSREVPAIGPQVDQVVAQAAAHMTVAGGQNVQNHTGIETKEMFDQVFIGARA